MTEIEKMLNNSMLGMSYEKEGAYASFHLETLKEDISSLIKRKVQKVERISYNAGLNKGKRHVKNKEREAAERFAGWLADWLEENVTTMDTEGNDLAQAARFYLNSQEEREYGN